jgi:hypothetical protein
MTVGCEGLPAGPSLAGVTLTNLRTQSTIGDPSLCCCHVLATVRNANTVGVHATIKFAAFDNGGQELSRTVYFLENFAANTSRDIDAPGFVFACNLVRDVKYELSVRGLTQPAP